MGQFFPLSQCKIVRARSDISGDSLDLNGDPSKVGCLCIHKFPYEREVWEGGIMSPGLFWRETQQPPCKSNVTQQHLNISGRKHNSHPVKVTLHSHI